MCGVHCLQRQMIPEIWVARYMQGVTKHVPVDRDPSSLPSFPAPLPPLTLEDPMERFAGHRRIHGHAGCLHGPLHACRYAGGKDVRKRGRRKGGGREGGRVGGSRGSPVSRAESGLSQGPSPSRPPSTLFLPRHSDHGERHSPQRGLSRDIGESPRTYA